MWYLVTMKDKQCYLDNILPRHSLKDDVFVQEDGGRGRGLRGRWEGEGREGKGREGASVVQMSVDDEA